MHVRDISEFYGVKLHIYMCIGARDNILDHFFCPQFFADDAIQSGTQGLPALIDQNASVVVKPNKTAIGPSVLLLCPHDNGMTDVASSDFSRCGRRALEVGAEISLFLDNNHYAVACVGWVLD